MTTKLHKLTNNWKMEIFNNVSGSLMQTKYNQPNVSLTYVNGALVQQF
jgi:hypothetical protein